MVGRREFLVGAFGGGVMMRMGWASTRVSVGIMGTNGRGSALASTFARLENVDVSYVCDPDERAAARAAGIVEKAGGKAPKQVADFRRILEDKSVDALVVAAPDHWHAPAAIAGCAAGKHVYVEKPCSHNPREGELLIEAARKHRRVVQMGNQRRSWPRVIEGVEAARGGAIGRVYYCRGWYANSRDSIGHGKAAEVPSWLDYNLWQGPAPRTPYRDNVIHYNWHWFWNWGTGEAGNNGIHALDLCRWALDVQYPRRVYSTGGRLHFKDDWETPDTQVMNFEFDGGRQVMWENLSSSGYGLDGSGFGASFHGEKGTIVIGGADAYSLFGRDGKLVKKVEGNPDEGKIDRTGPAASLDAVHIVNFLDAIRNGAALRSEIAEGHKSTLLCQLGNISLRTGRALRCDPSSGHIVDDKESAALWGREYEPGWEPKY
jgi:predicted dehydrogenase